MMQKNKILLVDDHPLVREWLANLINQQPDMQVCGEAGNAPAAFEIIRAAKPDIAVVDISLDGGSGIELIKDIKTGCPDMMVVVLSMHDEALYAERVLRAGARGYIMKREVTKKILQAIRAVLGGEIFVSDKISKIIEKKFIDGRFPKINSPADELSDRELEIFQLLGRGMNSRQGADHLNIAFKTVQSYSARIKEKLKLANGTQLLHEAIRWCESQQIK